MRSRRSTPVRILVNFFSRFAARILSILVSIVVMGMLGRYLGERQYGEYTFWYGLIFFLQQFSDIGLEVIIVREIARNRKDVSLYFGDAVILKASLSALFMAVIAVLAVSVVPAPSVPFLLVVSLAAVVGASQDVSIWVFRGIESMEYEAVLTAVSQLVWITCIYFFISEKLSILHMLAAQLAANVLRTGLGITLVLLKGIKPSFRFDRQRFKEHLRVALPVGVTFITSVTYNYANIALLKWLAEPEDIAAYSVGTTLTTGFLFLAITLTTSFFPVFSRYVHEKDERLPDFYAQVSKYLVLVAAPISVGLLFVADEVIALVFHHGFATSILSLQVLSLTLVLRFMNRMYRFIFPAADHQTANLKHEAAAIVVNVLLSLLLISRYGYLGASMAFVAGETLLFTLNYLFMSRAIAPLPFLEVFCKPLAASLVMGMVLFLLRGAPLLCSMAAALLIYPAALLLVRAFSRKELEFIRGIARTPKRPMAADGDAKHV
ncbi:MAG: flippase [bacterium]